MELADDILALLVLTVVALAPGGAVLALCGAHRRMPPELVLPASLLATILLASIVAVLQLSARIDGTIVAVPWGVVVLASLGVVVAARRSSAQRGERIIGPVLAVATACAVVGFVAGGLIHGDALYHATYAERLAELPDPGFASSQLFVDGSPHAGYLAPGWHFLVAQASIFSSTSVIEVMRAGSALTMAVAALAFAGLGRLLLGSSMAGALTALGFLCLDVLRPGDVPAWGASTGMWPGSIALWIGIPVALGAWLAPRDEWRSRTRLAVVALAASATTVLHVTYALWFGWTALAWTIVALLRLAASRGRMRGLRTILGPTVALAVGVAVTGAAYAALSAHVLGPADAVVTGAGAADRQFFAPLLARDGSLRVAPHVFAALGAGGLLALLGVAGSVLVVPRRATAVLATLVGVVLVVSQLEPVTTAIAHAAGLSHVVRMPQSIPLELGVAVLVLAVARLLAAPPHRVQLARTVAGLLVAGAFATCLAWPPVAARFAPQQVPDGVAAAALVAAAFLVVGSLVAWWRASRTIGRVEVPRITGTAVVLVALAIAPSWAAALPDVADRVGELDTPAEARDGAALLEAPLVERIRALPPGSIVLGPIRVTHPVTALAPVYVVAYPSIHTANTKRNRRDERIRATRVFVFGSVLDDAERFRYLQRERVSLVVVPVDTAGGEFIRRRADAFEDVRTYGDLVAATVPRGDR